MSYTYTTFVAAVQTMIASQAPDVDFTTMLPSAIDFAEQRIYRELNLLETTQVDTSVTTVPAQRYAAIPNTFVVVSQINVLIPAGSTAMTGQRVPLVPLSLDAMNMIWPGNSTTATPAQFAMQDQWTVILGPSPDNSYTLEIIGEFRPTPLSSTNPTTYLSTYLPDLFFAAAMIFYAMYMRNFASAQGQSGSDPLMSGNWEAQFDKLLASAALEDERRRFWSSTWSPYPPSKSAQPQRG